MKTIVCLLVVVFGASLASAVPIVEDNFNSYSDGSVVGQGSWRNRVNGDNFIVQSTTVLEGAKSLYINVVSDNVIVKKGTNLTDGMQTFYVKTEDRNSWADYSRIDFKVMAGGWDTGINCNVSLQWNGNIEYIDENGDYNLFASFLDNEWTKIDVQWRQDDVSARYRVNDELWTDWYLFGGGGSFTGFDNVGIDFSLLGGSVSGGAYFDMLGDNPITDPAVPEPTTIGLLAFGLLLLRRRR